MTAHSITMLGTGLIGDFYTMTLHGQRGRDRVQVAYSRSEERGRAFAERWDIPVSTTSLEGAINHPDTDVVVVALPNFLHEEVIDLIVAAAARRRLEVREGDRKGAAVAIPDQVVDDLIVHGPPEKCREHIQRYVANGVDTPVLGLLPLGIDPRQAARDLAPR